MCLFVETEVYPCKEENSKSMKTKLPKILSLLLTVVLLASLMIGAAVTPAAAGGEAWTTMSYPRAAGLGGYIVGPALGVTAGTGPMEMAVDGTLYAYWDIAETDDLYKSTDGGRTWSRCSTSTDGYVSALPLTAIACSPEDANILYITDGTDVFRSSDAGATFVTLVSPAAAVTALAVGYSGGNHFIYIGSAGDVFMMQDSFGQSWASTGFLAGFAGRVVTAVAVSPNFATEGTPQAIAISTILATTSVTYSYGGAAWIHDTLIVAATSTVADIAFPADYVSTFGANDLFVGINGTGGDVYRVVGGTVIDTDVLAAATPITSVAVAGSSGSCKILATGTANANVYRSADNGTTWQASSKDIAQITGVTAKYLVMADDYLDSGTAWIATVQAAFLDESSVAQTTDAGVSWNDLSMINTDINQITNLAVSPDYANDSTYFMVTDATGAAQNSVWKYDGSQWNRVFTNAAIVAATTAVQFSPDFASDSAVFLADTATPAIYRSTNGGGWFKAQLTAPGVFTGSWIVLDSSTLIVGQGTNARISKNNGTTWSNKGLSGATGPAFSFAKSPDYANDSTLLLGDTASGLVYRSADSGGSWSSIPAGVPVVAAASLSVAFDADYASNSTVYAVDGVGNDVYRLVIGTDTSWKQIDAGNATNWPAASTPGTTLNPSPLVPGVQAAPDGALYVADAGIIVGVDTVILRSINPTASRASTRGVYFEPMNYGFSGTAANLDGVWYNAGSNQLWTLESAPGASSIWVYTDDLTVAPELTGPADGTNTGRTLTASLGWSALPNCPRYEIWVSTDSGFSTFAGASPLFSTTTGVSVAGLASGRTYYWKVSSRAGSVAASAGRNVSPWSATWSVTTGIAGAEWTPFAVPAGVAPSPGDSGVSIRPAFQWNPADWATGYEFELSLNPGLTARGYFVEVVTSATGDNALGSTVWMCDRDLDYSTTYYWHVKAVSATSKSEWGTGVFTTEAAPVVPEPPPPPTPTPEPTTPGYIWAVIGIGAALCLAVIVLIVRTRRVV